MKPLEGIKVLEFSFWLAGPAAGAVLGEWGADVIKIEDLKSGDPARGWLETGILPPASFNYIYEPYNRNKRNLALDMRQPQGKELVYKLVKWADVFLTNVRRGALSKMGLDYPTLSQLNPQLIYACNTGLGTKGPDKDRMSFDELAFWARSGVMSCLGEPEDPPPIQIVSVGDLTTGMYLAEGVLLGLLARQRNGKGMEVNTSLLHSGVWTAGFNIEGALAMNKEFQRLSRIRPANPFFNTYPTKDGWLMISLYQSDPYWADFCRALDREDIINDPRLDTHEKRLKNNVLMFSILEETFPTRSTEEWKARLRQYDLPWEAMQTCLQVLKDPQVLANEYMVDLEHPKLGKIKVPAVPIQINQTPFHPSCPAPERGQHSVEILRELGYSAPQLEELKRAGVIA